MLDDFVLQQRAVERVQELLAIELGVERQRGRIDRVQLRAERLRRRDFRGDRLGRIVLE